jgi:hypothetical protein
VDVLDENSTAAHGPQRTPFSRISLCSSYFHSVSVARQLRPGTAKSTRTSIGDRAIAARKSLSVKHSVDYDYLVYVDWIFLRASARPDLGTAYCLRPSTY